MSVLIAHPTGNANVKAASLALYEAGWLKALHSGLCWNSNSLASKLLPEALRSELDCRSFPGIPFRHQHSHPMPEVARLLAGKLRLRRLLTHETGMLSVDHVYNSFDRQIASVLSQGPAGLSAVYAYEDAALATFQATARLEVRRIYELPIGYWKTGIRIFQEEAELQPAWAGTLDGLKNSAVKLARKDAELQAAQMVIVPSAFVRSTLEADASITAPIHVVPYGAPPPTQVRCIRHDQGPLRVLFVGSLGQRKGMAYLLEAVQALGTAVLLTLVGSRPAAVCEPLDRALALHTWHPSLHHGAILEQMRSHDVLVLPSLFEGYALVLTEALSQGLPVIATANSGATECVSHGINGFIVPIRDSQAIATHLLELDRDRDRLAAMRAACLDRAIELSWLAYRNRLRAVLVPLLETS